MEEGHSQTLGEKLRRRRTMPARRKHRNLVYVRLWWQITPICITLFIVCLAQYLALPDDPVSDAAWAGAGILFLLIGILALSLAPSAYVECLPHALRLRYPLYTLHVPYTNIENTRLNTVERYVLEQWTANKRRKPSWSERAFLEPLAEKYVVLLRFREMPRRLTWLRLWINRRWLNEKEIAVVVGDWLALRREIDEHIAAALAEQRKQATPEWSEWAGQPGDE